MKTEKLEFWRCKKCGYIIDKKVEGSIGTIHAHCEKHTGFFSLGNISELNKYVEIIRCKEYEVEDYEN